MSNFWVNLVVAKEQLYKGIFVGSFVLGILKPKMYTPCLKLHPQTVFFKADS